MVTWQTSYQNAEGEYHRMNEELLQEIPLSALANVRPKHAVNPPVFSSPLVSTPQNAVPTSVKLPSSSGQSAGQAMDAAIQAGWANLSTLRKSYPGAPPLANWGSQGFNVPTSVAQGSQAKIPRFFNFIGSSAGDVHAATEVTVTRSADFSVKEKSSPISVPDHPNKPGWVWNEWAKA